MQTNEHPETGPWAFNEASGPCLTRVEGNDDELKALATRNATAIGAGHTFVVAIKDGYPINVLRGQKAALGSLEYRFPITTMEQGSDTKPFYYRRLHGAVFAEAGNAWDGAYHGADLRRSVGAEARLDMTLAYYLPLTIRFVVAKGLDRGGEFQAYVGLWVPLEL